jgi:hypothetical protein
MNKLYVAARQAHALFRRKKWRYCLIGGLVLQRWGEQRATTDVDFTLLTGFGDEERFVDELLNRFRPRLPEAREIALRSRIVLCQADNGADIDVSLGALPFEERMIERASAHTFAPRMKWITASAEDMVILKVIADRGQDWLDVKGILRRQIPNLDWRCIERELKELTELKEDETILPRLQAMRRHVEKEIAESLEINP